MSDEPKIEKEIVDICPTCGCEVLSKGDNDKPVPTTPVFDRKGKEEGRRRNFCICGGSYKELTP